MKTVLKEIVFLSLSQNSTGCALVTLKERIMTHDTQDSEESCPAMYQESAVKAAQKVKLSTYLCKW